MADEAEYIIPESKIFHETRVIKRTIAGLENKIPLILHQGGTGSGKTYGIVYAIIQWAMMVKNWTITICSKNMPHLRRGAMRDFQDIIAKCNLGVAVNHNKHLNTYFFTETETLVEFLAVDSVDKAHGAKRHLLYVNECNHISYQIYRQLAIRTSHCKILDWNPSSLFYLHSMVLPGLEPDEYLFTNTTFLDNPAIGEQVVKDLNKMKLTDPENYEIYALGKTGKAQGLIFKKIFIADHFPKDCKMVAYGLDFGFTNANTALVKFGLKGDDLYLEELLYQMDTETSYIIDRLDQSEIDYDDELVCDPQKQEILDEIADAGYNVIRGGKGQGSVIAGIDLLKRYNIHITKNSVNFLVEANNYRWKETTKGKVTNIPIDEFNDLWDATRYVAQFKIRGKKSKKPFHFKHVQAKSIGLKF